MLNFVPIKLHSWAIRKLNLVMIVGKEIILTKVLDLLEGSSTEDIKWLLMRVETIKQVFISSPAKSSCNIKDRPLNHS